MGSVHLCVTGPFQHLVQGSGPSHHQGGPEDGMQKTRQVRGTGTCETKARGHREQDHDREPRPGQFDITGPARADQGRGIRTDNERTPGTQREDSLSFR
jgi:hypothetical protein